MASSAPLVSIIIPTYNRAHLIGQTLDSVLTQTYINWECIVVDDGSTDATETLMAYYCAKDSRFQYHHRPTDKPKGANACRNYGFELSKGDFINWFDDDDVMLPEFISFKLKAFSKQINIVICSGYYTNEVLQDLKEINLHLETYLFKDYVLWKFKIVTNNILFRKEFLNNKELFQPHIVRAQEAELFSRLFYSLPKNNYKILNTPLFFYRQHASSKTSISKNYTAKFKFSQSLVLITNLKRGIELNDQAIKSYCFGNLVQFFFEGLNNKDFITSKFILKSILPLVKKLSFTKYIEIYLFGIIFMYFRRGSYYFEKRWKSFKV